MEELPQNFADRFGWENMAATVSRVHRDLPQEDRSLSCILTGNYGEAAAIEFFGDEERLPRVISGHNSYHTWGPGDCTGEVLVSVGVPRDDLEGLFGDIEKADTIECDYCMPDENGLSVFVLRDPRMPLAEAWPRLGHYD